MIFSNIINVLLGDRVKLSVIILLFHHDEGLSGRSVSALVDSSTFKVGQVLKDLVAQGIVSFTTVGRSHRYRLNRNHILVKEIITPLIEFEKSSLAKMGEKILQALVPKPISIIVYGSIARSEEAPDSDIDLLLIYEDDVQPDKISEVGELINEITIENYGNAASVRKTNMSELSIKIKDKNELIRNIMKEGRVIAGLSIPEVLENVRQED